MNQHDQLVTKVITAKVLLHVSQSTELCNQIDGGEEFHADILLHAKNHHEDVIHIKRTLVLNYTNINNKSDLIEINIKDGIPLTECDNFTTFKLEIVLYSKNTTRRTCPHRGRILSRINGSDLPPNAFMDLELSEKRRTINGKFVISDSALHKQRISGYTLQMHGKKRYRTNFMVQKNFSDSHNNLTKHMLPTSESPDEEPSNTSDAHAANEIRSLKDRRFNVPTEVPEAARNNVAMPEENVEESIGRRSRRSSTDDEDIHQQTLISDADCQNEDDRCCRMSRDVSFADLGWNYWIVYPDYYTMYYCKGSCPQGYRVGTTYATIKSQMNVIDPDQWDPPCCTASRFSDLPILLLTPNGPEEVNMEEMVVEECMCL